MSFKETTLASYQATAEQFALNVAELAPFESIERFCKLLPTKARIIDIGCGTGRDAKVFSEKGLSVVGIDLCPNMIKLAKAHAPLADFRRMDIEAMSFPEASFDGAWAGASLLHIPKNTISVVLDSIYLMLKPQGIFYLTLREGIGEELQTDLRYGDFKKFWAFYEQNELNEVVKSSGFTILESCIIEKRFAYQQGPSIRIFCQKK